MVPFAFELHGAKGKQARKLLLTLANASEELSAAAFLQHASAALSVALQCGNADIRNSGCAVYAHELAGRGAPLCSWLRSEEAAEARSPKGKTRS